MSMNKTEIAEVLARFAEKDANGELLKFNVPGFKNLNLILPRRSVDQAIIAWEGFEADRRVTAFDCISKHLTACATLFTAGDVLEGLYELLGKDGVLFLAHELRFGDGEKHLLNISMADIQSAFARHSADA